MKSVCANCAKRPALFHTTKNRRRRACRDHDLCERCWRATEDRRHAVILINPGVAR